MSPWSVHHWYLSCMYFKFFCRNKSFEKKFVCKQEPISCGTPWALKFREKTLHGRGILDGVNPHHYTVHREDVLKMHSLPMILNWIKGETYGPLTDNRFRWSKIHVLEFSEQVSYNMWLYTAFSYIVWGEVVLPPLLTSLLPDGFTHLADAIKMVVWFARWLQRRTLNKSCLYEWKKLTYCKLHCKIDSKNKLYLPKSGAQV